MTYHLHRALFRAIVGTAGLFLVMRAMGWFA